MPWAKSYEEFDVLNRAAVAFWKTGYEGTSMAELVKATGLNRGSIYSAFTDKRNLFLRALEHYDQNYCRNFLVQLRQDTPPKAAILSLFDAVAARDQTLPGGCLMINSALEVAPHDAEVARQVNAAMQEVEGFFYECITAAVAEGTIRQDISPRIMAHTLLGLLIGIRVLTRAKPYEAAINSILKQVDELLS